MTAQVHPVVGRNAIVLNKKSLLTSLILIVNITIMYCKPLYGFEFGQNYDVMQENITILPGVRNFSDSDEPEVVFTVFETPKEHHSMLQILANQVPITNFSHFNVAPIHILG
ncbi:hypothetical protein THRCLA_20981 [Thraustotheca clavata]|uniref:Uncharacterized protein n=1 Tax=Thraustotheca clavata TaxID=74557 RepID=A0A1W0A1C4_9STRA|nr:hypothetical protein THRCLA_20981 [Thraustotheca clavata]